MSHALLQYRELEVKEFLDGRYFARVLKPVTATGKNVALEPLILRIRDGEGRLENVQMALKRNGRMDDLYCRLIIETHIGDEVRSRHSNLLIFRGRDHLLRFEPSAAIVGSPLDVAIDEALMTAFPDRGLSVDDEHPQVGGDDNFCNAYVLKYAYFSLLDAPVDFDGGEQDIRQFVFSVRALYGGFGLNEGPPDVEFDPYNGGRGSRRRSYNGRRGNSSGALAGGLIGGGIGAAAFGVPGLLIGAGAGSLIGRNR